MTKPLSSMSNLYSPLVLCVLIVRVSQGPSAPAVQLFAILIICTVLYTKTSQKKRPWAYGLAVGFDNADWIWGKIATFRCRQLLNKKSKTC